MSAILVEIVIVRDSVVFSQRELDRRHGRRSGGRDGSRTFVIVVPVGVRTRCRRFHRRSGRYRCRFDYNAFDVVVANGHHVRQID